MKKFRTFLSFDFKTKFLFIEAFLYLGLARIQRTMPFARLAPKLGKQMEETSYVLVQSNKKFIRDVSFAINVMSCYTFWESMCLVKAIAGMKMLERRKINSTLYLGTAKDENGKLIAHAWLRSGPFFLTGFEEMEKFTVVNKFAKEIRKV